MNQQTLFMCRTPHQFLVRAVTTVFAFWLLLGSLIPAALAAGPVTTAECFPVEKLPAELQPKAEKLLLEILDNEGLFTLIGGLKPVSQAFSGLKFKTSEPDLSELEELRTILAALNCGDHIYAGVHVYARDFDGERHASAYIVHRASLARLIQKHHVWFSSQGITPNMHPAEVMMAIEHSPREIRSRLYGYVFGYPDDAVDFFVNADAEFQNTKEIAPRRFINIPVQSRPSGRFVYAVTPKHVETERDQYLRREAAGILAEYQHRRQQYVGEGKPGAVALLRDWFSNAEGKCVPEHATYTIPEHYPSSNQRAGLPTSASAMQMYADSPDHVLNQIHQILFIADRVPAEVAEVLPEERERLNFNRSKQDSDVEPDARLKNWYFKKRPAEPHDRRIFGGDVRVSPVESLSSEDQQRLHQLLLQLDTAEKIKALPELASPVQRLLFQWDLVQLYDRWQQKPLPKNAPAEHPALNPETLHLMAKVIHALALDEASWKALSSGLLQLKTEQLPKVIAATTTKDSESEKTTEFSTSDSNVASGAAELTVVTNLRYLPADLLAALQGETNRWVEVERRSTKLFHAANSLRAARVFIAAPEGREQTEALLAVAAAAQDDSEVPELPLGTETAVVLSLVGWDQTLYPVATQVVDEIRVRRLDGPLELSELNTTTSKDGWNQWIYFRSRKPVAEDADPFRQIFNDNQAIFLEYGTAKHTTYAGQCALCHRNTDSGKQAPNGVRSLSRYVKPSIAANPLHRLELAETELQPLGERLRQSLTAPASHEAESTEKVTPAAKAEVEPNAESPAEAIAP